MSAANSTDVYFFTHDSLAAQDHNGPIAKIYDARADGGFFEVPKPPPCARPPTSATVLAASPPAHRKSGPMRAAPVNTRRRADAGGTSLPGTAAACANSTKNRRATTGGRCIAVTEVRGDPTLRPSRRTLPIRDCVGWGRTLISGSSQRGNRSALVYNQSLNLSGGGATRTSKPPSNLKAPANQSRAKTSPSMHPRESSATPTRSPSAPLLTSHSTSAAPTRRPDLLPSMPTTTVIRATCLAPLRFYDLVPDSEETALSSSSSRPWISQSRSR